LKDHDPYKPATDKEIGPTPWDKMKDADDLFDFTVKERREMFGAGNRGVIEAGLCDGQKCIHHWVKPYGVKGCACRLAKPGYPRGEYYRDRHQIVCTQGGRHEVTELGCDGFSGDPAKIHDRKRPAYMKKVYVRKVV